MMLMLAAMMLTATMSAQPETGKKPVDMDKAKQVEVRTQQMVTRYQLTSKQAKKVKKLNEKYMCKMTPMKPMREAGTPGAQKPSEEQMAQFKKDHEAYNAELKKIMTEEQFSKYQADAKKRFAPGKMKKGDKFQHGPHHKGACPDSVKMERKAACCKKADEAACCKKADEACCKQKSTCEKKVE